MSEAAASPKGTSESVRISRGVKKRLQKYCRRHKKPLRRTLDEAVRIYVQEWSSKE